jgi:hypothetical protein
MAADQAPSRARSVRARGIAIFNGVMKKRHQNVTKNAKKHHEVYNLYTISEYRQLS